MIEPILYIGLKVICGICWTLVYLVMIRKGFGEKTYCMPAFAIFFNISWEFIFAFIMPFVYGIDMGVQLPINIVWFVCDVLVLATYLLYGPKYFPKSIGRKWFLPWSMLGLAVAFSFVLLISLEFSDYYGMYAAFIQSLMMSVLFIDMLIRRGSAEGQSLVIAVAKWAGTLAMTIFFQLEFNNSFILYLGIACAVFDLIYIALLYDTVNASKIKGIRISVKNSGRPL